MPTSKKGKLVTIRGIRAQIIENQRVLSSPKVVTVGDDSLVSIGDDSNATASSKKP
jgi:hypothetical protein